MTSQNSFMNAAPAEKRGSPWGLLALVSLVGAVVFAYLGQSIEVDAEVTAMRDQLTSSLTGHFSQEIERSLQDIWDTITPYTRFVRAENEKNQKALETLREYHGEIIQLESEIENPDRKA